MIFPLSIEDISFWLAITSLILIITSEFISPYIGKINLIVDKGRLRKAALISGALYLLIVLIQIYDTLILH